MSERAVDRSEYVKCSASVRETSFEIPIRRAENLELFLKALPQLPPKAYRWVPEMYEIARTFEGVGLIPRIFQGQADMFEMVAAIKLGKETPETRDNNRTGKDVIKQLADDR